MMKFDEKKLILNLEMLSPRKRLAFSVAAASRIINNYGFYSKKVNLVDSTAINTMESLWAAVLDNSIEHKKWESILSILLNLIPEENTNWTIWHALIDDAISSLAYAIRCMLTSSSQEAAWAARRAYEAADQVVCRLTDLELAHDREVKILSHPLIQRELERQTRDLNVLRIGVEEESIQKLYEMSKVELLYIDGEENNYKS